MRLLRHDALVIVDETYFEFAGHSCARLVAEFDNLVILRDCGPWAGLGGLAISYALTSRPLATALRRAGLLEPPNRAAQLALLTSLGDREALMARVRQMRHERGRLFRQIRKLNLLDPLPSDAPFLLCAVRRSSAGRIAAALAERASWSARLPRRPCPTTCGSAWAAPKTPTRSITPCCGWPSRR